VAPTLVFTEFIAVTDYNRHFAVNGVLQILCHLKFTTRNMQLETVNTRADHGYST